MFPWGVSVVKKEKKRKTNSLTEYQSIALTAQLLLIFIQDIVPLLSFTFFPSPFLRLGRKMDKFLRRLFLNHEGKRGGEEKNENKAKEQASQ